MHATKVTMEDVCVQLPSFHRLNLRNLSLGSEIFICANGFEQRSLKIPEMLATAGYRCWSSVMIEYSNGFQENQANLPALVAALRRISERPHTVVKYESNDFAEEVRKTIDFMGARGQVSVVFDITGCSAKLLLARVVLERNSLPTEYRTYLEIIQKDGQAMFLHGRIFQDLTKAQGDFEQRRQRL